MLCPNCKKEIENDAVFCEHCGARIKKSKKGLWITLSVIIVAVVTTIVVITVQEQQAMERNRVEQRQRKVEQQLQAERIAKEEAEHEAELARQEAARNAELVRQEAARKAEAERQAELLKYVDLGLPSGTLWKNANEGGDYTRYTYDQAVRKFGNKLPTKQQFEELKNECEWTWLGDGYYKVTGPNGESITLPAVGYSDGDGDVNGVGAYGLYWSSTPLDSDYVYNLDFDSGWVRMNAYHRCCELSVRLVQ